jgi:cell division septation protein DedD
MGLTTCRVWRSRKWFTAKLLVMLLVSGRVASVTAVPDSGNGIPIQLPSGPAAKLAAAHVAPCSTAVRVFQELSADSTVPDSLRMVASGCRADIAFALREYETARDYYKKAMAFEKELGRYHYRLAVAALANGDTAEAVAVLSPIIDSGEITCRHEAEVQRGELLLGQKDYTGAMALFRKTGPFSSANSWSVPALLGKLACARHLGLADSAAAYDKKLSVYRLTILEKQRLRKTREIPLAKPVNGTADSVLATATAKDTAAKPADRASDKPSAAAAADTASDTTFALQVGAFGSKANAQALMKKLAAQYKHVSCVPAVIDERTFYRVWVGSFETREAAERFGKDKLMRQGLVYRVVVK